MVQLKLPRILLICCLCLGMLIMAVACSSNGTQDDNNTEPPQDQEEPIEPPPDDNGTIDREERNLFAAESLEGIYTKFAVFGVRWDDDGRDSSFTLSTEGSDTYGEKLSLLIEEQSEQSIDFWLDDGIIVKVEPEDMEYGLIDTNGDYIFGSLFAPMFMFNAFHEQYYNAPDEFIQIENRGSETRNLVHMSTPVTNHFVRMNNPLSGDLEWTLTYSMGNIGGFDMAIEWAVETADESVLRYEITELKLR